MKIKTYEKDYAIVKSKKKNPKAFVNIIDDNEITLVVEQDNINKKDIIQIEKGWKLITFDEILDFGLVGFLAKISKALADEKISIFVISAYSTDHLLVKKEDYERAIKILRKLN